MDDNTLLGVAASGFGVLAGLFGGLAIYCVVDSQPGLAGFFGGACIIFFYFGNVFLQVFMRDMLAKT